jgi:HPt (histidine-containing phosphotransfer) domain-containing protein
MTSPPLIDEAVILDLIESIGEDGLRSVVELFTEECQAYVQTMSAPLEAETDPAFRERLRRTAHAFKSGAGQIGALRLAAAAADVERAASDGRADLAQATAYVGRCVAETIPALRTLLEQRL